MKSNERYTWRACIDGYTDTGLRKGITEGDAVCQLADYEDTGLSPKEIKFLIDEIKNMICDVNPAEITYQIENGTMKEWCLNWQQEMFRLIKTASFDYTRE